MGGVLTAGTIGRSSDEDTHLLRGLLGQQGATVTLQAGRTYRTRTANLAAGLTLVIPATTIIELLDDGSTASTYLFADNADDITIRGDGTIRSTSGARTAVYGLVRADAMSGLVIDGITFGQAPSAAVYANACDGIEIRNFAVADSAADGLHFRSTSDITVEDGTIDATGDDAVGLYNPTSGAQGSGATVRRVTIDDVIVGRGVAVIGHTNVTLDTLTISNIDQSAISVHGGVDNHSPANVAIIACDITTVGRDVPVGGTDDGIYIEDLATGSVTNNSVDGAPGYGLLQASSTNVTRSGNTYANCVLGNESIS